MFLPKSRKTVEMVSGKLSGAVANQIVRHSANQKFRKLP